MEFKEKGSIYLQIAEYICDQVLIDHWPAGTKIPSIRELSVNLQVNSLTVQRAYDLLQQMEIISNKRGIGYFTTPDSTTKILDHRRQRFLLEDVPAFIKNLILLDISPEEILLKYEFALHQHRNDKK